MFKRIVLVVATLAVIGIAFTIYQWGEEKVPQPPPIARKMLPSLTSKPSEGSSVDQAIAFKGAKIAAGESPKVTILDDKGNAKIVFKASHWKPLSDTAFELTNPEARLLLPGGQLAYVWADSGHVDLAHDDKRDINPKKGWLRGNVRIFVDRSKPEWRQANLERADPEQHPEMLVKIWLDDVDYDLELGRLNTAGPIKLQSVDGSVEGRGLELIWNETDRQIRKLRILQGRRATIRNTSMIDFGVGGKAKSATTQPSAETEPAPELAANLPNPAQTKPAVKTLRDETLQFQNLEEDAQSEAKANRIDTYTIEFHDHVVAEQKEGDKTLAGLKAELLQLMCDFGREERAAVEHSPTSQPAQQKKIKKEKKNNPPEADSATAEAKEVGQIQVEWTGELVATPEPKPESRPADEHKPTRLHLVATGSPVELFDSRQGSGTCRRLEYHGENKQVWLTGTPDDLVVVNAGPDRQLAGEKMFFDRKLGIATIEGPGHMTDLRQKHETDALPECMRKQAGLTDTDAGETARGAELRWNKKVAIEFAVGPAAEQKPDESAEPNKLTGYLRHAVFEGQVVMNQQGQSIQADHVEAFFAPPAATEADTKSSPLERSANVENLVATGNVHMQRTGGVEAKTKKTSDEGADELYCDRLEVEMTNDDVGHNVPKIGRALGHVFARRVTAIGRREIRTEDKLVLTLASVPKVVEPQERERLEAAAKRCGFGPGSPQWEAIETKLRNRRKMAATAINAEGGIKVHMLRPDHPEDNFDMTAESIDCTLREDEEITRALIVGTQEQPAVVDSGDIYVKGPRISIDMPTLTMEVPGAGRMRFMTRQDLTGRATGKPVPVVVNWQDRMSMRGEKNIATFAGAVRAVSANTSLDCKEELRIEFENLPPATSAPAAQLALTERWLLKPLFASVRGTKKPSPTNRMTDQMRKRPKQIWAVGDAVIVSTDYAKTTPLTGPLTRLAQAVLPARLTGPASQPAETQQIQSRFRVAGPQIHVDLIEEHFSVEGQGNLLVEDRRLPQPHASKVAGASASALSPNMTSLDSSGPSQTLFQWKNSMSYLNKRNVAEFQSGVIMDHLSGSKMAYAKELLTAANLDPQQLAQIKSRQAHMTSDNLAVQFDRQTGGPRIADAPLSRVTRLRSIQANGKVLLELDEGKQSVTGTMLSYDDDSGDMFVNGSSGNPALVLQQNEKTGQMQIIKTQPGKPIEWNQRTGTGRTKGGSVISTGK